VEEERGGGMKYNFKKKARKDKRKTKRKTTSHRVHIRERISEIYRNWM
jgi:hypothetical protein